MISKQTVLLSLHELYLQKISAITYLVKDVPNTFSKLKNLSYNLQICSK